MFLRNDFKRSCHCSSSWRLWVRIKVLTFRLLMIPIAATVFPNAVGACKTPALCLVMAVAALD
ncbi:secreted protein [methanotrophic bacterial endosymbiont of Bathymodiolus sp.]|nr:secreted protein [methanotrophic bacterial endosymbiont of Bathymodiolus sp.]